MGFVKNGDLMILYFNPESDANTVQISRIKFICKSKMDKKKSLLENFFNVELEHMNFVEIGFPQKNVKIAKFISQYRFDSVVIVTKDNKIKYFVGKGVPVENCPELSFSYKMTKEKDYENDTILDIIMPHNVSSTMVDFIKSKR